MPMSRRLLLAAGAAAIAIVGAATLVRGPGGLDTQLTRFNTLDSPSGAAIKGYDPVAYFVDGAPKLGKAEFTAEHGGVRWQFSSAGNKQRFLREPDKYLPAFGGYCAYGVAQGYLVKIDPKAWSIRQGTLYLNYDPGVQKQWEKDPEGFIDTARKAWPDLIKQI